MVWVRPMESFLSPAHRDGGRSDFGAQVQGSGLPPGIQRTREKARSKSKRQVALGDSPPRQPRKGAAARVSDKFYAQVHVLFTARLDGAREGSGLSQGRRTVSRSCFYTRVHVTQSSNHCFA